MASQTSRKTHSQEIDMQAIINQPRKRSVTNTSSLWIHYLFRVFTINSKFIPRIHYEFKICSANSLWIHYLFTMNSLSGLRIHYKFTICSAYSLWIQNLFRVFTICSAFSIFDLIGVGVAPTLWVRFRTGISGNYKMGQSGQFFEFLAILLFDCLWNTAAEWLLKFQFAKKWNRERTTKVYSSDVLRFLSCHENLTLKGHYFKFQIKYWKMVKLGIIQPHLIF